MCPITSIVRTVSWMAIPSQYYKVQGSRMFSACLHFSFQLITHHDQRYWYWPGYNRLVSIPDPYIGLVFKGMYIFLVFPVALAFGKMITSKSSLTTTGIQPPHHTYPSLELGAWSAMPPRTKSPWILKIRRSSNFFFAATNNLQCIWCKTSHRTQIWWCRGPIGSQAFPIQGL